MDLDRVSIVIPAYNEEATVGEVVKSLLQKCSGAEIIVVNDGSTDATAERAAEAGARVISRDRTRGYGASLRAGTLEVQRDYVLYCDADGQHNADDALKIVQSCEECAMVVGARDGKSHVPLLRYPGKFILRWFANVLAGERIPDLNSGLRIVKTSVIKKYLHLMPRGFSFSTTSTFALLKGGYMIRWIPITAAKRSGTSQVRQLRDGPRTLMLILRLAVLFEPLKVFLAVDLVLAILAAISLGIDLWVGHFSGIGDVSITLCIATLTVFLFGLLCDQVSALRREIHE